MVVCAKGDPERVRALLAEGADPNTRGNDAIGSPWEGFLNMLLRRQRVDEPVWPLTEELGTGLVDARRVEVVRLLLEHHANPNVTLPGGTPAIWYAVRDTQGDGLLTLMLQHGADPNAQDRAGTSLLMYAIYQNNMSWVRTLLDHGAKPDLANADGDTPLMWAAYQDDTEVVARLLASGVEVDHKNNRGETALMYTLANFGAGKPQDMLLDAGADVNLQDKNGATPFLYALYTNSRSCAQMIAKGADVRRAVPASAANQRLDVHMEEEFGAMDAGFPLNVPVGATPLMLAARGHDPALVKALLAKGADVNAHDSKGQSALDYVDLSSDITALLQHAKVRQ
jgi:ankyrin repeat protein